MSISPISSSSNYNLQNNSVSIDSIDNQKIKVSENTLTSIDGSKKILNNQISNDDLSKKIKENNVKYMYDQMISSIKRHDQEMQKQIKEQREDS